MIKVSSTTIKIPRDSLKKGVVILDAEEYRELQIRAVPTYYLIGKRALALDRLVEEGLREYRAGRTVKAPSMREALRIYERKHGRRRV